jgi:hypothetical protein
MLIFIIIRLFNKFKLKLIIIKNRIIQEKDKKYLGKYFSLYKIIFYEKYY